MERLDACYFCGTAAEAPLREVTISPRARQGDPDATVQVTLCPSCEDKLERVLGGLFDHVESRRTQVDDAGTATEPDDPTAGTGRETAAPPDPEPVDRIDVSSGDGKGAGRRDLRELSAGPDDGSESTDPDDSDDSPPAEASDTDEPTQDDAEIIEDDEPTVRARATASSGEGLDGVSVAEYNRVMRLLQNREFPMARTAFVDLAASAYDLGEETVDAVLDAVIESGSLADRDGQLVREGEGSP